MGIGHPGRATYGGPPDRGDNPGDGDGRGSEEALVHEPVDLERSRLLLVWLQARRALDHCLSDLLAGGPAGERRVRERLDLVEELENRAKEAFAHYRAAALSTALPRQRRWLVPTNELDLGLADLEVASVERGRLDTVEPRDEPARADG